MADQSGFSRNPKPPVLAGCSSQNPLNIGIGIHTGPAILGRLGVKAGSGAAQRITALGDTANTASRLESACKELTCQLVVSEATIKAANQPASGGSIELITFKRREQKVSIVGFSAASNMVIGI